MREEIRCALDGVSLDSLDPRLYVQDVEEHASARIETADRPGGARLRGGPRRVALAVTVRFMVKERDRAARQRVISRVNAWAREGWLTVSTRPGQRLYVICVQAADSEALRWSGDAQVVFAAYERPYWQDQYPIAAPLRGSAGTARLCPTGTRPCPLEAEIANASEKTVNGVSLAVNGKTLAFSGLGLAAGQTLRIGHDGRGLLYAEIDGAGRLDRRTPESDDDLALEPARGNDIVFAADGPCAVRLMAKGVYD